MAENKLTSHGTYRTICYKNGLRMFKYKKNTDYLARQYANRCINPKLSFDKKI